MNAKTPLDLLDNDALIAELNRRFPMGFLFMAVAIDDCNTDEWIAARRGSEDMQRSIYERLFERMADEFASMTEDDEGENA